MQLSGEFTDGVVIAQGGTAHGWSLFMEDNSPRVSVRIDGKLLVLKSSSSLPVGNNEKQLVCDYSKTGQVSVKADGKVVLLGDLGSSLLAMPLDPLEVGQDTNGIVGPYRKGFNSNGRVLKALLKVKDN